MTKYVQRNGVKYRAIPAPSVHCTGCIAWTNVELCRSLPKPCGYTTDHIHYIQLVPRTKQPPQGKTVTTPCL
jgi:hypothetical protein